MIKGVIKYSALKTKLSALSGKLLTPADFNALKSSGSVLEATAFLKSLESYKNALSSLTEEDTHRGQVELLLWQSLYEDIQKINRFLGEKDRLFMDAYFIRYEIRFLAQTFEVLLDDSVTYLPLRADFGTGLFGRLSGLDVIAVSKAKNIEEYFNILKSSMYKTISNVVKPDEISPFDLEMHFEIFYFRQLFKVLNKKLSSSAVKGLKESCGALADMYNLKWIYRAKKYFNIDPTIIYSYLLPAKLHLSVDFYNKIISERDVASVEQQILKTPYAHCVKEGFSAESIYDIALKIDRKVKAEFPYSVAIALEYIHKKDLEIKNIITAIESIRYQNTGKES
ncbi:MAG: V-type ATPase subunit [Bacillota bacterium]|nr:V-type ATPase subunit [Bacillota bacterium]